jgi:acyl dehydratase
MIRSEMNGQKRYFEDLAIGEIAESSGVVVDREEMLDFARRYDPQYFHTDPTEAQRSIFGEVIASGIYTAALWRRQDALIGGDIAWVCGIAWEDVRWPEAVRAGDTLRARAECLAKRESNSQPTRGVVEMRYTLVNQRDAVVFTCRSINLVERRPPSAA